VQGNGNWYNKKKLSDKYISKYKRTNIYKKSVLKNIKKSKEFMKYIICSYENYIKYLNDTDNINYEFIWDLICEPTNKNGVLFKTGINLIILKQSTDDLLEKISLTCPNNYYSNKLKILGTGEIKDKVNIEADLASKSAIKKLEKIDGSIQLKK